MPEPLQSTPTPGGAPRVLTLPEAAEHLSLSLNHLRRMMAEAPADLPGAPIPVGSGSARRHVRWFATDLEAWFKAYGAWRRGETHRPARTVTRRAPSRRVGG